LRAIIGVLDSFGIGAAPDATVGFTPLPESRSKPRRAKKN
jgi:phosphopentomutase